MDTDSIKEKIRLAKKIVSEEDEPYKTAAYQVILRKMLDEMGEISENVSKNKPAQAKTITSSSGSMITLQTIMDKIDVEKLSNLRNLPKILDQCLVLLGHIIDLFPDHEGLTIEEIRKILIDKFGLTTITLDSIRMALVRVTGKYVTRTEIKAGKTVKYMYKILTAGKEHVKTVSA